MRRASRIQTPHRGCYILDGYELRVTARCLTEDLGVDSRTAFFELVKFFIVRALMKDRAQSPTGTKTVGPEAGGRTIYRLGYGNDHRGAT